VISSGESSSTSPASDISPDRLVPGRSVSGEMNPVTQDRGVPVQVGGRGVEFLSRWEIRQVLMTLSVQCNSRLMQFDSCVDSDEALTGLLERVMERWLSVLARCSKILLM
jgi:hypothetical protein